MEHLEGETLANRLKKGPVSLQQALQIATQIADALAAAHRAGIIHRDLKPGNIMLVRRGETSAKLLDFGLAKMTPAVIAASGLSVAPTAQTPMTMQGTILGTLQYMAPEQIEGQDADARTDIFAFGAVLYEMLTGVKAFEGKTHASVIAAVLDREPPPVSAVQPLTPPSLDHLVRRCLAKSPEERWQSASDVHLELKWVTEIIGHGLTVAPGGQTVAKWWWRPVPMLAVGVLALLAAIVGSVGAWMVTSTTPQNRSTIARLSVTLPEGVEIPLPIPSLALSPDGAQLVYVGVRESKRELHLRRLDSLLSKVIPGTDGAFSPFFSRDGQSVGFFAEGKLKTVSVTSGSVQILADAPFARGGSWGADGTIYFAPSATSGLWKISASGGTPTEVTRLDRSKGEVSHRWPQVLPGGNAILFTVWIGPGRDEHSVHVHSLESGKRHVIMPGADTGSYVSTGHLVYLRADALMAAPIDLDRLVITGAAIPLGEQVRGVGEGGNYAVSDVGALAYLPGDLHRLDRRLVWVDRMGRVDPLPVPPGQYDDAALSPDGRQVAVTIGGSTSEIWIYDLSRGTFTRVTTGSGGSSQAPIWTRDGTRIVYRGTRSGFRNLFWQLLDSPRQEERLTTKEDTNQTPGSWLPDGRTLVFSEVSQNRGGDIWLLRLDGDRRPQPLVQTPLNENTPRVSPDGRWLAYTSDESGRGEVYVQPFPGPGRRWQISTDGGSEPIWSRDGRELFYVNRDRLMAVAVSTQPPFAAGSPRLVFEGRYTISPTSSTAYDVSPDGKRFLRIQPVAPDPPANQIHVVMNWFEELRRLAQ